MGDIFINAGIADADTSVIDSIDIDKKKLVMPAQPIKEVGSYEIGVKLLYGLTAIVQLEVKTRA